MGNERYYQASRLEAWLEIVARMKFISFELLGRVLFFGGIFEINKFRFECLHRVVETLEKHAKTYAGNCKKRWCAKQQKKTLETPSIRAEKPNETKERLREDKITITTVEYNSSNSLQKESAAATVFEYPESLHQQPETKKSVRENPPAGIGMMGEESRFLSPPVHEMSAMSGYRCRLKRESQPMGEVGSPNGKVSFICRVNSLHLPGKLASSTVCARFTCRMNPLYLPDEKDSFGNHGLLLKKGNYCILTEPIFSPFCSQEN